MRFRSKKQEKKGSPAWMVTFSDLMTLILVFFVLLFAMSELDSTKFKSLIESFQGQATLESSTTVIPIEYIPQQGNFQKDDLDEVYKVIGAFLTENNLEQEITATRDERGVILVLQDRILFQSGEADILAEAKPFLDKLGSMLRVIPNLVKVEGHTDHIPITSYRYPSNWELSAARASQVIRYFITEHDVEPERFAAIGYGEYQPVATNETAEGRAMNRRVVIVISNLSKDESD